MVDNPNNMDILRTENLITAERSRKKVPQETGLLQKIRPDMWDKTYRMMFDMCEECSFYPGVLQLATHYLFGYITESKCDIPFYHHIGAACVSIASKNIEPWECHRKSSWYIENACMQGYSLDGFMALEMRVLKRMGFDTFIPNTEEHMCIYLGAVPKEHLAEVESFVWVMERTVFLDPHTLYFDSSTLATTILLASMWYTGKFTTNDAQQVVRCIKELDPALSMECVTDCIPFLLSGVLNDGQHYLDGTITKTVFYYYTQEWQNPVQDMVERVMRDSSRLSTSLHTAVLSGSFAF